MVYSDDLTVRQSVKTALGRRPSPDVSDVDLFECATEPAVIAAVDKKTFDLIILDGEAVPAGGMGVCRQLKDEIFHCPPILVIVGRPQDAWLATWSRADGVVSHPIDALALAEVPHGCCSAVRGWLPRVRDPLKHLARGAVAPAGRY